MMASVMRHNRSAVDRLRHHEACDEADGIEKSDEKHGVGGQSVEKCNETSHGKSPMFTNETELTYNSVDRPSQVEIAMWGYLCSWKWY